MQRARWAFAADNRSLEMGAKVQLAAFDLAAALFDRMLDLQRVEGRLAVETHELIRGFWRGIGRGAAFPEHGAQVEHRLTPPKSPQPNGMAERFNRRISDVLRTNRFDSALDLDQTLMRYVHLYNTHLPQSALRSRKPMQAMKDWYKSQPHLFIKTPNQSHGTQKTDCSFQPRG